MRVIRIKRTVRTGKRVEPSLNRRFILQFARDFFAREDHLAFMIEALLFGALLAISAWPIVGAGAAINGLL
jgi:hypothetical protein